MDGCFANITAGEVEDSLGFCGDGFGFRSRNLASSNRALMSTSSNPPSVAPGGPVDRLCRNGISDPGYNYPPILCFLSWNRLVCTDCIRTGVKQQVSSLTSVS